MSDRRSKTLSFNPRQDAGRRLPRQKAWSHQDDLAGAVGKRLVVWLEGEGHYNGTLLAADAFTIKLLLARTLENGSDDREIVLFKSALEGFEVKK